MYLSFFWQKKKKKTSEPSWLVYLMLPYEHLYKTPRPFFLSFVHALVFTLKRNEKFVKRTYIIYSYKKFKKIQYKIFMIFILIYKFILLESCGPYATDPRPIKRLQFWISLHLEILIRNDFYSVG